DELYLKIRYLLGSHLAIEIEQKGTVLSSDDITFASYLYEETELAHNRYFYHEDLVEQYEDIILQQLMDFGPNWLKSHLPKHMFEECVNSFKEPLTDVFLQEAAYENFLDIRDDLFEDLVEEYVPDLVKLIDIPFDLETHRILFEKDITERREQ